MSVGSSDETGRIDTFGDCEGGRPLIAENIETNTSVRVDVWMIDSCCEVDLQEHELVHGWQMTR